MFPLGAFRVPYGKLRNLPTFLQTWGIDVPTWGVRSPVGIPQDLSPGEIKVTMFCVMIRRAPLSCRSFFLRDLGSFMKFMADFRCPVDENRLRERESA